MMNKLTILAFLLVLSTTACGGDITRVKLTVTDDTGQPVSGAQVKMGFMHTQKGFDADGHTDSSGVYTATSIQRWGVRIHVVKEGYYKSERRVNTNYGDVAITLRPIKNPVPMYCRKVRLPFPGKKIAYGFDFEKSDWVSPYGDGVTPHMTVYFDGKKIDFWNSSGQMKLHFINPQDGLVKLGDDKRVFESTFQFPYNAPLSGYESEWFHSIVREKNKSKNINRREEDYSRSLLGYAFRLNTQLDAGGNVITANYGRISGDIFFSPATDKSVGVIEIESCYNPIPNERSLEVSKNLIKRKPKYSFESGQ